MNYYIIVDGGGSKLRYLLIDEHLNLHCSETFPGVNTTGSAGLFAREPFESCLKITAEIAAQAEVKGAVITAPVSKDEIADIFKKAYPDIALYFLSEGRLGLLAATRQEKGILTTAGTGSGVFFEWGRDADFIGGMGFHLGDEGSGYWIGQKALKMVIAAAYSFEKRTIMSDYAEHYFKMNICHESMASISHAVYKNSRPKAFIAGFAPYVFKAAGEGDKAAREILNMAVIHLARQTAWITKDNRERGYISGLCKASVSGGIFSNTLAFYNSFCALLHKSNCGLDYVFPKYEPVMGGLFYISNMLRVNESYLSNVLCRQYSAFEINLR